MNPQFAQPKGSTSKETNKDSIARKFGCKKSEVVYAKSGQSLSGYKVIYDKVSQRAYALPSNIGAVTVTSLVDGVLTHSGGTVDLGALAVLREEYVILIENFTSGFTIRVKNEVVSDGVNLYRWDGSLPKTVNAGETVDNTGGVNNAAWMGVGVITLRNELFNAGNHYLVDDSRIKMSQSFSGASVRSQKNKNLDIVTIEDFKLDTDIDDTMAFQRAVDSGAFYIKSGNPLNSSYIISSAITINRKLIIDLGQRGITQTSDAPHFQIGNLSSQTYGVELRDIVMGNSVNTSHYQIEAVNVGALRLTRLYCFGDNKTFGFSQITNGIETYFLACKSVSTTSKDIHLVGSGTGGLRTVDTTIYDCRFERGRDGIAIGNYCEGVFIRRNILYLHTGKQIVFFAEAGKGLVSGKIQENDIDSGQSGGIYVRNFTNLQICDNWFADTTSPAQIELDTGANDTIINGNQAYPHIAWLVDGGVGTVVTGNMVRGGSVPIYFKATANKTLIASNSIIYSSSAAIDVSNHLGDLKIADNTLSNGIGGTPAVGMEFTNNKGDNIRGTASKANVGSVTPRTFTVGPRPESIAFTGGSITSIIVNGVTMFPANGPYTGYISLGLLPPGSTVILDFSTSNQPWLTRVIG